MARERQEILRNKHNHIVLRDPREEGHGEAMGLPRELFQEAQQARMMEDLAPDHGKIQMLGRDQRQSTEKADAQRELRLRKNAKDNTKLLSVSTRAGRVTARCRWHHANRFQRASRSPQLPLCP